MEDGGVTNFKLGIMFIHASNMADILTEVMNLYSPGGLTCYWIISQ